MLEVLASGGAADKLTAVFGANEGTTAGTLSNNADKACRIGIQHYNSGGTKPFTFLVGSGTSGANTLNIGGGTSLMNGATEIRLSTDTATANNGGTERMRIRSTGIVGINNGGNRTLHVQTSNDHGNIGIFAGENLKSDNSATMFFLSTYRNSSSSEYFMQFNRDQDNNGDGVASVFRIATNGDVKNTNNSYGSISDIKLKENIVDANSQWDDIKAIKVRNFNFKTHPSEKLLGVVAQEIETVSAGLVEDTPDKDITKLGDEGTTTKTVKYSILYMKAIKCLQEAMAKIETLETKVAALESA